MIRKATPNDASAIATLMMLAMDNIVYRLINQQDYKAAHSFLIHFIVQKGNQYAYENCWVWEEDGVVIGSINVYDGGKLDSLRMPIINYLAERGIVHEHIEDETAAGEMYIDTLAILPQAQGKGIGKQMLAFVIDCYVTQKSRNVGLLVNKDNPKAKELYLKLGFEVINEQTLMGELLEHLQCKPNNPS